MGFCRGHGARGAVLRRLSPARRARRGPAGGDQRRAAPRGARRVRGRGGGARPRRHRRRAPGVDQPVAIVRGSGRFEIRAKSDLTPAPLYFRRERAFRHRRRPRFRLAVHTGHRPADPRGPGSLGRPSVRREGRGDREAGPERADPVRRPIERLRRRGASGRPRTLRSRDSRPRALLRNDVDRRALWRPGRQSAGARVREGIRERPRRTALPWPRTRRDGLDEPRRPRRGRPAGLHGDGPHRERAGRRFRRRRARSLWHSGAPGGAPLRARRPDARELPLRRLRGEPDVDDGRLPGGAPSRASKTK